MFIRNLSSVAKETSRSLDGKIITVFGGSGFLGRSIVRELSKEGAKVRVFSRTAQKLDAFQGLNVEYVKGNIADSSSVNQSLVGANGAVNLVGLLFEKGSQSFSSIHTQGSTNVADAAAKNGLSSLVHVSAIGADSASDADYARTKREAELAMFKHFPTVAVLRPSIVFGPEDNFFNQFAMLSKFLPTLPLFGGGHSKFQPVYVEDVAKAVSKCISDPESTKQAIYELGGPEVFTFRELMQLTLQYTGRTRILLPIPWPIAQLQGKIFGLMPTPLLTEDQVKMLKKDNIVSSDCKTFKDLAINPRRLTEIVPTYLSSA
eukprot:TRINITY_DN10885_c0_g1_i3.p1 TRINITY_DN10885_c0_g1~~TRINITY_DN10885_c0_g1_i3.p1  ORF type:complete len:318 (+),score=68.78 TRINITY_DN10885_c0_g1_i3:51-1004(+)